MSKGIHIIADLKWIDFANFILNIETMEELLLSLVEKNNLTVIGKLFHSFGKVNEFSWILMLAESHISIHTWPEKDIITLDVFACGLENDNRDNAMRFYDDLLGFLKPVSVKEQFIDRV